MDLITVVVLGTLGMLLLAITIVAFVFIYQKKLIKRDLKIQRMQSDYQKDLLRATIEAQEKERQRISRDLHDDIGAMLSTIRLSVPGINKGQPMQAAQIKRMQNTKELIDETVDHIRRLSRDLLPPTLDEFGLVNALEQLFEKIEINSSLVINFNHSIMSPRLKRITELALYRIIQELCNNIIKHANATQIEVCMIQNSKELEITIIDNGDGFVFGRLERGKPRLLGLGLKNIESRLNMINASITYSLAEVKGTKACIRLGYKLEESP